MATPRASIQGRFQRPGHDHGRCVAHALDQAEALCADRDARLTALRRRVLELVWSEHKPIGAYDILDRLSRCGRRAAPVAVYRALAFLMAQGFVHRIASRNAYVGCGRPEARHAAQFLICDTCDAVAELSDARIEHAIMEGAERTGFAVARPVVEVQGLCPACRSKPVGATLGR
ncbi:MAG: transcriptional repressor [Alphaproteobacteria bacterium]